MNDNRSAVEFSEQLIKGRIAELIFSQMFRNGKRFTVIPFGYENAFPEIAQYANLAEDKVVLETIRNSPDFALVSHDKREVYLVEVKYRRTLTPAHVKEMAEKINNRWKSAQLFIATPNGFFFDDCSNIITNNGAIPVLSAVWVSDDEQNEYIKLVNEFICKPIAS